MLNDDQTPEEAQERASHINNVHYAVDIVVSDEPTDETFLSTSTITFDSSADSTWIDLDAKGIRSATLNGKPIDITAYQDGRLEVAGLAATGNTLQIEADCHYSNNGDGLHRQVDEDGKMYMYSNCEPFDAHRWFACFDQPDIKGQMTLTVTAPSDWKVLGNYPVDVRYPVTQSGHVSTTRFEETMPVSTYLMAMCAGPFTEFRHTTASGVECGLYVRQSLAKYLDHDAFFEITEHGLEFYTTLFGRPLPCPKYDQVLCPQFNSGAMENLGLVTFRDEACISKGKPTQSERAMLMEFILHEMAHMWFGDEVTLKQWKDLWLNESSADLFEKISQDAISPEDHVWADFANGRKSWGMSDDQLPSTHPVADVAKPVSRSRDNFDGISYAKGGAALWQLIAYIGKDTFINGLQAYFKKFALGNASLEDYLHEMEVASHKDLQDWAKRWLLTTGMNRLVSATTSANGVFTSFVIEQRDGSGDAVLRPHVVRVGFYSFDAAGKLVRTKQVQVTLDVHQQDTPIPALIGEKVPDLVMVNDDDLTYAKIRFDDTSLETVLNHLSDLDDPLARATCWGMLWDMTRDGDLSAHAYIDAIRRNAPSETQTTVLEGIRGLIGKAATAINQYADPATRKDLRSALAHTAKQAMHAAQPGSDVQLTWATAYASNADSPTDLNFLKSLLDGSATVPGLAIDTNLRWDIVMVLVSHDPQSTYFTRADVDAEARRDGSDQGKRNAFTASAMRPTAAAKAAAWQQITAEGGLSLYDRQAWMTGFMRPRQEQYIAPFLQQYADFIPKLWKGDWSPVEARALTLALFPKEVVSQETLQMADDLLTKQLPLPALKIIKDQRDGIRRALAAREVDQASLVASQGKTL